jgi:hypothetical protein
MQITRPVFLVSGLILVLNLNVAGNLFAAHPPPGFETFGQVGDDYLRAPGPQTFEQVGGDYVRALGIYSGEVWREYDDNKAAVLFKSVLEHELAIPKMRANSEFMLASMRYKKRIKSLTDGQAFEMFTRGLNNEHLSAEHKSASLLYRSALYLERRAPDGHSLSDPAAFIALTFLADPRSLGVTESIKRAARLYRAEMRFDGRVGEDKFKHEQALNELADIAYAEKVEPDLQERARRRALPRNPREIEIAYGMALKHHGGSSNAMSSAQAFALFEFISRHPMTRASMRIDADYMRAKMRYENRVDDSVITDAKACELFGVIAGTAGADLKLRLRAFFMQAKMRYENRVDDSQLTLVRAYQFFHELANHADAEADVRAECDLMSFMLRYNRFIGYEILSLGEVREIFLRISDKVEAKMQPIFDFMYNAIAYRDGIDLDDQGKLHLYTEFTRTVGRSDLSPSMRAEANLLRAHMSLVGFVSKEVIGPSAAYALLTRIAHDEKLPEVLRTEAHFLRAYMRYHGHVDEKELALSQAAAFLARAEENTAIAVGWRAEAARLRALICREEGIPEEMLVAPAKSSS